MTETRGDALDRRVRVAAFEFLAEQTRLHGETLPWARLLQGFEFQGRRVPLVSQPGIFKPAILPEVPLTIRTAPEEEGRVRRYADEIDSDGRLRYRYRGTDPQHPDNVGLRRAMARRLPLIYLFGVVPGQYMPVWPVYVVGDEPANLSFLVLVDERNHALPLAGEDPRVAEARRAYVTVLTRQRLHQQTFRQRVLRAYQERCAICRLRRVELLEAAHILPDGDPRGEPVVPNGVALCTLHHAAFDRYILGIRPDLVVDVRLDVLREADGPMLRHGLQGFQGIRIAVPRDERLQPNREWLAERYERFARAS
ncbi:MAG TPA: HNH endonuclease [Methylomirabilota bacterium]|jgi:putative restriction endonuclease|nr:HNH endonuclease [Methylomirabilota bacterium]